MAFAERRAKPPAPSIPRGRARSGTPLCCIEPRSGLPTAVRHNRSGKGTENMSSAPRPDVGLSDVESLLRLGGVSTAHLRAYQVRIVDAAELRRPDANVVLVRAPALKRWFGLDAGEGWDP